MNKGLQYAEYGGIAVGTKRRSTQVTGQHRSTQVNTGQRRSTQVNAGQHRPQRSHGATQVKYISQISQIGQIYKYKCKNIDT